MRLVIDGYNLLHAMGPVKEHLGPDDLERARSNLLGRLVPARPRFQEICVVFDAGNAPPGLPTEAFAHGIHVLYSHPRGKEADDVIERLMQQAAQPRELVVVSDDHRIRDAAKGCGCQPMRCEEFLDFLERLRTRKQSVQQTVEQSDEPSEKMKGPPASQVGPWLELFSPLDDDPALEGDPPLFPPN